MVGEYAVEQRIGTGSFGDVYAGEHPVIGKRAAIKVLHKKFTTQADVVSRFQTEAKAVNKIRHRNIIDIFSLGQLPNEQHYCIMELLEGETLEELLERRGKLSLEEAYPILKGVADGLDAAHAEGIAHRDMKPDNVFVAREKDGTVLAKILDFGVAKLLNEEASTHKTGTGMTIGTPLYMSPEQARGRKVDPRADVYAFGIVIFQMLTGKVPFNGETAMDVLLMHISDAPPNLSEVGEGLPAALDPPIRKMLEKKAKDRTPSAGVALRALMQAARTAGMLSGDDRVSLPEIDARASQPIIPKFAQTHRIEDPPPATERFPDVPPEQPASPGTTGDAISDADSPPAKVSAAATGVTMVAGSGEVVLPASRSKLWMLIAVPALGGILAGVVWATQSSAPADAASTSTPAANLEASPPEPESPASPSAEGEESPRGGPVVSPDEPAASAEPSDSANPSDAPAEPAAKSPPVAARPSTKATPPEPGAPASEPPAAAPPPAAPPPAAGGHGIDGDLGMKTPPPAEPDPFLTAD